MYLVQYEKLPGFSFHCGKMGHEVTECVEMEFIAGTNTNGGTSYESLLHFWSLEGRS